MVFGFVRLLLIPAGRPVPIGSWQGCRQGARLSWLAGRWLVSLLGLPQGRFRHPPLHSFSGLLWRHRVGGVCRRGAAQYFGVSTFQLC